MISCSHFKVSCVAVAAIRDKRSFLFGGPDSYRDHALLLIRSTTATAQKIHFLCLLTLKPTQRQSQKSAIANALFRFVAKPLFKIELTANIFPDKFPYLRPQMLKKYTAILMMTIAYAILLGHSIIPHHHHDSKHDLIDHQYTDHDHHNDADSEDLSHLFAHFAHSADGFIFTTAHSITNTFCKQQLSGAALLPDNFHIDKFLIPPLLHKPPAEHLIYISPHSHSKGLRAPPAFIG